MFPSISYAANFALTISPKGAAWHSEYCENPNIYHLILSDARRLNFRPKGFSLKNFILQTINRNLDERRRVWEAIEWADKNGILDKGDYVTLKNGDLCHQDDCWYCDNTEEYFHNDDESFQVRVSGRHNYETWCRDAVNNDAFFCNGYNEYFSDKCESVEVNEETYSLRYAENNFYYWDSDNEWHSGPEEEENDIPDYHDVSRNWKNPGNKLVFGVELELKAKNDRADVCEIANSHDLIGEQDGSLCSTYGIEIVGPPLTLAETKDENGQWLSFLEDVKGKAIGWDAGTGYGLHVSINRRALTNYHTGKLLCFIHHNKSLCEHVAGRDETDYTKYVKKKVSSVVGRNWQNKLYKVDEGEKYEALALRGPDRLECRIFRSTLKKESFLKAVEFVAASVEFTRDAGMNELTEESFRAWLKKNNKEYKNLALFLKVIKENKIPVANAA